MNELKSGYIDIHTHILPGVDDGAKDIDMTSKMLQIAYEQGVRSIIATPHFQLGKKVTKEEWQALKTLKKERDYVSRGLPRSSKRWECSYISRKSLCLNRIWL